jgi:hypothetical protein
MSKYFKLLQMEWFARYSLASVASCSITFFSDSSNSCTYLQPDAVVSPAIHLQHPLKPGDAIEALPLPFVHALQIKRQS